VRRTMARVALGGKMRPFTAARLGRPPRGERACRMWRRRRVGNFVIAAGGEWVAG